MPCDQPRPLYSPATGHEEPLDAIQEALVRMWVDILVAEIREELAAESSASDVEA